MVPNTMQNAPISTSKADVTLRGAARAAKRKAERAAKRAAREAAKREKRTNRAPAKGIRNVSRYHVETLLRAASGDVANYWKGQVETLSRNVESAKKSVQEALASQDLDAIRERISKLEAVEALLRAAQKGLKDNVPVDAGETDLELANAAMAFLRSFRVYDEVSDAAEEKAAVIGCITGKHRDAARDAIAAMLRSVSQMFPEVAKL